MSITARSKIWLCTAASSTSVGR